MGKRYSNKRKIELVKLVDEEIDKGATTLEAVMKYNISNTAYFKWKTQFENIINPVIDPISEPEFKIENEIEQLKFQNEKDFLLLISNGIKFLNTLLEAQE